MKITILGIRHHGVGSSQNVVAMLKKIQPDIILVESPPELNAMTHLVGDKNLKPPVAVLCYDEALPQRAVFYPLAEYSPEWQAMLYANTHKIPVRMMDLPVAVNWTLQNDERKTMNDELLMNEIPETIKDEIKIQNPQNEKDSSFIVHRSSLKLSPLDYFANIGGYDNSESWWEDHFEHNFSESNTINSPEQHFEAVMLVMSELRKAGIPSALEKENVFREAYMGQIIRQAQREMFSNIVVVCGAWHAPALLNLDKNEKEHETIIKKLPKPKIKVGVTWIPWTNDRLWMSSGYGAGIMSPGWYGHLWKYPNDKGALWLSKVARLFREKKMDTSTAHVIEALRLTEALAGMRNLPRAGLFEMNEAVQSVMCMGDSVLMELVRKQLIVGSVIGKVPDNIPKLPIQTDFELQTRLLRIPQTAEQKTLELDLRKPLDLSRSIFLHRLIILKIEWGSTLIKRTKGTFKEIWKLKWKPEMLVNLIEKGIWGNTIEQAAGNLLIHDCAYDNVSLSFLSECIAQAIPAELFYAIEILLTKIEEVSVVSGDIQELMSAIIPLSDIGRYGNVRKTDLTHIYNILESLLTRVCIGLPNACYGLDEDTTQKMFELIRKVNEAVRMLDFGIWTFDKGVSEIQSPESNVQSPKSEMWFKTLSGISKTNGIHAIIKGCTTRLLFDAQIFSEEQTSTSFGFALSKGNEPKEAAGWLEGFLKGSGMILLYDNVLWHILNSWLEQLEQEAFVELLPILRRTFSKFEPSDRKKLGEKAKRGNSEITNTLNPEPHKINSFDNELAEMPLPLLAVLLGF